MMQRSACPVVLPVFVLLLLQSRLQRGLVLKETQVQGIRTVIRELPNLAREFPNAPKVGGAASTATSLLQLQPGVQSQFCLGISVHDSTVGIIAVVQGGFKHALLCCWCRACSRMLWPLA